MHVSHSPLDLSFSGISFISGGALQQNGHTTAEIQEEVALTNMGTTATTEKRNSDKIQFARANLQTITVLGKLIRHIEYRFHSSDRL